MIKPSRARGQACPQAKLSLARDDDDDRAVYCSFSQTSNTFGKQHKQQAGTTSPFAAVDGYVQCELGTSVAAKMIKPARVPTFCP